MKKTLFLSLILLSVSAAHASITPDKGTYGFNALVGNEVFTEDSTLSYNAVLNVGTYAGEGHLTLEENVTLTLPNALLIGGKGYSKPVTIANNGSVLVKQGAVINVGDKTTSSGGHHVDIGNSDYHCTGLLTVDGGTVNAGQMLIGQGAGTGTVVVNNGGVVNLSWDGITPQKNPANDQIGLTMGANSGTGHLILDHGTFTDTTGMNAFFGAGGDATVEVKNGSSFESNSAVWMGDIWGGAYGVGTGTDTLSVSADSAFSSAALYAYVDSFVNNAGTLNAGEWLYLNAAGVSNSGTLITDEISLYSGASIDNQGTLDTAFITLGSNSKLITGTLTVSGCEEPMNPDHAMSTEYTTGIAEGADVVVNTGAHVTVGAHVTGGETMQYLYSQDFRDLDTKVLEGLNLQVATDHDSDGNITDWEPLTEATAAQVTVANVIGKNISANVTTDEAHHGGDITVALSGSHLVVRVGDNGSSTPTEEDREISAEKVGTIGSYHEDVTETDASVRLHTSATDSSVAWEGHALQTVSGETSMVNDSTSISVGSAGVEGTLTVVEESTLQNKGAVSSDKVVVNGTLDNNGTISAETTVNGTVKGSGVMAATTLAQTATLIVGNSPGYSTFTDSLTAQSGSTIVFSVAGVDKPASLTNGKGWESCTYSQIVMENGAAVTLCEGVNITIAFGGEELCSALTPLNETQFTPFELVLIKGGVASTTDLVSLMDHTTFVLSNEPGALPLVLTGQTWVIDVANAEYRISEGNLILSGNLKVTRTPEPATASLSLLALAALASRRRRK